MVNAVDSALRESQRKTHNGKSFASRRRFAVLVQEADRALALLDWFNIPLLERDFDDEPELSLAGLRKRAARLKEEDSG